MTEPLVSIGSTEDGLVVIIIKNVGFALVEVQDAVVVSNHLAAALIKLGRSAAGRPGAVIPVASNYHTIIAALVDRLARRGGNEASFKVTLSHAELENAMRYKQIDTDTSVRGAVTITIR